MHIPVGALKALALVVIFAIQFVASRRRREKRPGIARSSPSRAPAAPGPLVSKPPDAISNEPLIPR